MRLLSGEKESALVSAPLLATSGDKLCDLSGSQTCLFALAQAGLVIAAVGAGH